MPTQGKFNGHQFYSCSRSGALIEGSVATSCSMTTEAVIFLLYLIRKHPEPPKSQSASHQKRGRAKLNEDWMDGILQYGII